MFAASAVEPLSSQCVCVCVCLCVQGWRIKVRYMKEGEEATKEKTEWLSNTTEEKRLAEEKRDAAESCAAAPLIARSRVNAALM